MNDELNSITNSIDSSSWIQLLQGFHDNKNLMGIIKNKIELKINNSFSKT